MLLRQARYFVAVVDAGSFTEAAEKLFISQSAVSQQIKALEEELGVPLLLRAKRTFSLTPAGEYFYRRGKALIEETDAILRETIRIGKGEKQHLHIGYLNNFSGLALSRAVADFVNIYPDVDIKLRSGTHEELYDALENYDIDMAMSDQRRAFSEEYVNVELSEAPVWLEVSAGSCHSKLEAVEVEDLHTLPCILLAKGEQQAEEQSYYQKILGFPGEFLFAGSMEEARLMVVSEQGFLPVEDIGTLPAAGDGIKRIAVLRHGVPLCRRYCIFWKKEQGSALVDKFAEILRKYISS